MNPDQWLAVFVAVVWLGSIFLVCFLFWKLQKEYAQEKELEIKEKISEMEKDVATDSLEHLVDSNNNEDGKS